MPTAGLDQHIKLPKHRAIVAKHVFDYMIMDDEIEGSISELIQVMAKIQLHCATIAVVTDMLVAMNVIFPEAGSEDRRQTRFRRDMQDAPVATKQPPILEKGKNQPMAFERPAVFANDTLAHEDASIRLAHVDEGSVTTDVTRRLHQLSRNPPLPLAPLCPNRSSPVARDPRYIAQSLSHRSSIR